MNYSIDNQEHAKRTSDQNEIVSLRQSVYYTASENTRHSFYVHFGENFPIMTVSAPENVVVTEQPPMVGPTAVRAGVSEIDLARELVEAARGPQENN